MEHLMLPGFPHPHVSGGRVWVECGAERTSFPAGGCGGHSPALTVVAWGWEGPGQRERLFL